MVITIIVIVVIINSLFQPGDFSAGSTTVDVLLTSNIIQIYNLRRCGYYP